jgi:hypothetical protein
MKIGKYRITVTRSTEVEITVADLELFNQDYEAWKAISPETADYVTEENFLAARAIISVAGGDGRYNRGIVIIHKYSDQHIEHHRTCRHCGCKDDEACDLESGPCGWHDTLDCCTNPDCIAAEEAESLPILSPSNPS